MCEFVEYGFTTCPIVSHFPKTFMGEMMLNMFIQETDFCNLSESSIRTQFRTLFSQGKLAAGVSRKTGYACSSQGCDEQTHKYTQ